MSDSKFQPGDEVVFAQEFDHNGEYHARGEKVIVEDTRMWGVFVFGVWWGDYWFEPIVIERDIQRMVDDYHEDIL